MAYYGCVAKEVHMAQTECNLGRMPSQSTSEGQADTDLEDFERDELLHTLRLEEWFATAERGVPIWCY
jgi:hypothetical protein